VSTNGLFNPDSGYFLWLQIKRAVLVTAFFIELFDGAEGDQLAQFMIDNNVGVTPVQTYDIKRIDMDYFADE